MKIIAKKSLGQNFLIDNNIIKKIINCANIKDKEILLERLSNRDMKDKLIVEERMKQFDRDVLHWINYDYIVINDNLKFCLEKIQNLIDAEINNGSKDYDKNFIINHIKKLTS